MKPPYSYYTEKMWRDFIPRWRWNKEHNVLRTLPPVQAHNYDVCADIWDRLTAKEQAIIEATSQSEHDRVGADVLRLARQYNVSAGEIWAISHRINKTTGIRRGLVDGKDVEQVGQNS